MLKKYFYSVSALLLLNQSGFSQEINHTRQEYNLLGSVKACNVTTTIFGEKPEDDFTKNSSQIFNDAGYLIEAFYEMGHGVMGSSVKYTYNEKNQIIEIIDNTYNKPFVSVKNTYDEKGYITENRNYNSEGKLEQLFTFIYNDKMEIVLTELRIDSEKNPDQLFARFSYRYNALGLVFEIFEDWNYYETTIKFSYNAKGKVAEEYYSTTKENADESQNYSLYRTYNDDGWLIGIVYKNKDGKILKQESFVYDHLERLTHHNQLNALGKVVGYTQYTEFDETADNWTKSVTYEGKKMISSDVREISYF